MGNGRCIARIAAGAGITAIAACGGDGAPGGRDAGARDATSPGAADAFVPPEGTAMRFDPGGGDFFDLPFPDDARLENEGDFEGVFTSWPGPGEDERAADQWLLGPWLETADDLLTGWGLSSAIFAYFSAPIDPYTIPQEPEDSLDFAGGAPSVFLVDVDPESPERGELMPISCQFREESGRYHDENQLACISPAGVTRRPDTRYALVITGAVIDEPGDPVVPDESMARLLHGHDVDAGGRDIAADPYVEALEVVSDLGVSPGEVASLVLFTTHDPSARLRRVNTWYRDLPPPAVADDTALSVAEVYDDYVVLEGHYDLPVIQDGEEPYLEPPAGRIRFGSDGEPERVGDERIRFYLTVPREEPPAAGFPAAVYLHGSGGVAEQLMNRGAESEEGEEPEPGTGPAGVLAPYGVAGFAADFNLHGMRHDPPDTTGLVLYNIIGNPRAAIDNFIVAANEVTRHARLVRGLEIEVEEVDGLAEALPEGADQVRFDDGALAAFGQSMGSTIGLPALTVDPLLSAGVFSGSGGVLIEIALEATEPIPLRETIEAALNYGSEDELDRYDPMLSAVQHAWDLADPVAHGRFLTEEPHPGREPTHALQPSGLTDGYFSPKARAAFSTAIGAELLEPVLEPEALAPMAFRGVGDPLEAPVAENRGGATAVVRQYEPSVLDGHHVAFQREDAKAEYACFLRSLASEAAPVFRSFEDVDGPGECLAALGE